MVMTFSLVRTVWFTWLLLSIGWHGFLSYEKLIWCLSFIFIWWCFV